MAGDEYDLEDFLRAMAREAGCTCDEIRVEVGVDGPGNAGVHIYHDDDCPLVEDTDEA